MRMKPLKIRASSTEKLKQRSKKLKKTLSFTPAITRFFKGTDSKCTKSLSTKLEAADTPSNILRSPISRSSNKKHSMHTSLTPIKLSFKDTLFDFPKLPTASKDSTPASSPVCRKLDIDLCPPTPPLPGKRSDPGTPSQTSHSTPSLPHTPQKLSKPITPSKTTHRTPRSHQSFPSPFKAPPDSPIAPPYSPIATPSPQTQADIEYYGTLETPFPSKPPKEPSSKRRSLKLDKRNSPIRYEVIVISSDSDESDTKGYCKSGVKKNDRVDCLSESDRAAPKPKKVCIENLKNSRITHSPGGVEFVRFSPAKWQRSSEAKITTVQPESKLDTEDPLAELSSQFSSSVKLGPTRHNSSKKCERLSEVQSILWKRGTPHVANGTPSSHKVKLLNAAQSAIVESHLDSEARFLSDKLHAVVQYLMLVTSPASMPQGNSLATLFLIISDPELVVWRVHPEVRDSCVCYLSQLLLTHPPGSHRVVDQQYREFLQVLEDKGDVCTLWELLQTLILSSSEHCSKLLSFLVDLLLSDYWSTLHKESTLGPLFLRVFWSSKEHSHVTTPIRQLIDEISKLIRSSTLLPEKVLKLDSLLTLLYLASTVCSDLTSDLLAMCKSLPTQGLHLLLGRLHSLSLFSHIVECVPGVEECLVRAEETFTLSLTLALEQKSASVNVHVPVKMEVKETTKISAEDLSSFWESLLQKKSARVLAKDTEGTTKPETSDSMVEDMQIKVPRSGQNVNSHTKSAQNECCSKITLLSDSVPADRDEPMSTYSDAAVNSQASVESKQAVCCSEDALAMDTAESSSTGSAEITETSAEITEMAWETVTYGEDKFPCVRRSPAKPKTSPTAKGKSKELVKIQNSLSGILPRKALVSTKPEALTTKEAVKASGIASKPAKRALFTQCSVVQKPTVTAEAKGHVVKKVINKPPVVASTAPKPASKRALFTQPTTTSQVKISVVQNPTAPTEAKGNVVLINNSAYVKAQQKSGTASALVRCDVVQKPTATAEVKEDQQKSKSVSTQNTTSDTCQSSTLNTCKPSGFKGHPKGLANSSKTQTKPLVPSKGKPSLPRGLASSKKTVQPPAPKILPSTVPQSNNHTTLATVPSAKPQPSMVKHKLPQSKALAKSTTLGRVNTSQKPPPKNMVKPFSRPSSRPQAKASTSTGQKTFTKAPVRKKDCENCKTRSCVRCEDSGKLASKGVCIK